MSTINMTLPKASQEFVAEQVVKLGLAAPEEYVERLIEEKQKEELWAYYEKEVGKAIDRNVWYTEEEFWEKVREKRELGRKEREARKECNASH